ncbi:MAG: ATP synthase F1 subunit gamma [Gemmatimonadetes bacterium]|nr:ATP synthase F1 subunit gamma [Gemmatimonadota bacterium]
MQKARLVRRRIRAVRKTRDITHTMEMVAASKLRRAQERVVAARPYAAKLAEVMARLFTPELAERYPILRQPVRPRRAAVLLLTSNRGLAGAFNANLIREAQAAMAEHRAAGVETELHVAGRKGVAAFRFRRIPLALARSDIGDRPALADARSLADPLMLRFETGELDAVDVVFAHFKSPVSTPAVRMRILPVTPAREKGVGRAIHYLFEPSADEILARVVPLYVRNTIYRALVENAASEQGARRTAMKNATDNAEDMIERLTRTLNKARQAEITQQLAEIVGGAEALKG